MSFLTAPIPQPISANDLLFFTKQLGVLTTSGVGIAEALPILAEQAKNPSFRRVINALADKINNGQTLSEALAKFPRTFDSFYRSVISVGEQSGTLDKNLLYLARELGKSIEFRRKIQGVLLYPTIVVTLAVLVAGGIAFFVLPQLTNLFLSLNIELPLTTRILLLIANFSKTYGVTVALMGLLIIILLVIAYSIRTTRSFIDPILLRLPILGGILRNTEVAKICRNVGLMLRSGLPIAIAFTIVRDSTGNTVYRRYLTRIIEAIQSGKSLESELDPKRYPLLPATLPKMLGVGEHSGTLDDSFLYLGDSYAEEVDDLAKKLPTILEPILLVAIAGVVLFVALAIISPIYQFTGSIHK